MKKFILLTTAALALSSCSWFNAQYDYAFGDEPPANNNSSGYPYYYSASAPIDAPNQPMALTGSANAAPANMPSYYNPTGHNPYPSPPMTGTPAYPQNLPPLVQPAQQMQQPAYSAQQVPQQQMGGYSVTPNSKGTGVSFGNKGTDVEFLKKGATPTSPAQPSMPYQKPADSIPPQNLTGQPAQVPVQQPQVPYGMPAPQPQYAPQGYAPQPAAQPVQSQTAAPQANPQGLTSEQQYYQQLYYGQQYAPQTYQGQYQYPPVKQ